MIDIIKLYQDYGVTYTTTGTHAQPGWVQVACPFCGDSTHDKLGFNIDDQYYHCWKCGKHSIVDVLAALLSISRHEALELTNYYALRPALALQYKEQTKKPEIIRTQQIVNVPGGMFEQMHIDYLQKRKYNPYELQRVWNLTGTGIVGDYKYRIICPIYHKINGQFVVVSYQGRDVTGQAKRRWKACEKANELRDHKYCLGGCQLVPGDAVAVVEGYSDAWRLGPGAVCTFGTSYLAEQVELLLNYHRRFIILDSPEKDPNAQKQAEKLIHMLSAFHGENVLITLDNGDPGEMPQDDADYLMQSELSIR